MSTRSRTQTGLDGVRVGDQVHFAEGPPHELIPDLEIADTPKHVESGFANQLKTLPVRLLP